MKLSLIIFFIFIGSTLGFEINLNRAHKSLLNLSLEPIHEKLAEIHKIDAEIVLALSKIVNSIEESQLTSAIVRFKTLELKDISKWQKQSLPIEILLSSYALENGKDKIELLKFYNFMTSRSIIFSNEFMASLDPKFLVEFELHDIFMSQKISTDKIIRYAYYQDGISPLKKSVTKLKDIDKFKIKIGNKIEYHYNLNFLISSNNLPSEIDIQLIGDKNFDLGKIVFDKQNNKIKEITFN